MTPAAGDGGAPGRDHKNGESSNLRLQISFILQPGRQKPPVVQHLAGDHTGSLGKARERSQVSAGREHPLPRGREGERERARSQRDPTAPPTHRCTPNFKQGQASHPFPL